MMKKFLLLILSCSMLSSFAGRPVFHEVTRDDLIQESDFIFSGHPSPLKPIFNCSSIFKNWWVHKVYKGDKSLEGKTISIAIHQYKIYEAAKNSKLPSFASKNFRNGDINLEQSTSFLFTHKRDDGCFELAANGAQEHQFKELEIDALLTSPRDCYKSKRALELRIDSFQKSCEAETDCKIFYLNPNTCEKPFVLNKSTDSEINKNEFISLQNLTMESCRQEWGENKCEKQDFPFRCFQKKCIEGNSAKRVSALLEIATIQESCAPHDALAVKILIARKNNQYPMLSINWWGDHKPSLKDGEFILNDKSPKTKSESQGSYCLYKGSCRPLSELNLKLKLNKEGQGRIFYEGKYLIEGISEMISGEVPVTWITQKGVICG